MTPDKPAVEGGKGRRGNPLASAVAFMLALFVAQVVADVISDPGEAFLAKSLLADAVATLLVGAVIGLWNWKFRARPPAGR